MSDERNESARIAVLETQVHQAGRDIERIAETAARATDKVDKRVTRIEVQAWLLVAGIAAFLAAKFFDIFRGPA